MKRLPLIGSLGVLFAIGAGTRASVPAAFLQKMPAWYESDEARKIAETILTHQADTGGWDKNVDTTKGAFTGDRKKLLSSFDNNSTTDELRFLARVHIGTKDEKYKAAFLRGLDVIFKAQYPTGGWPQSFPPDTSYHRFITFNDNAMGRIMEFLREVSRDDRYQFVDSERKQKCDKSFAAGVECILKCQITVDGKLTAWCAQHDEKDLKPRIGRSYELVSLSGSETVGITRLLMSLEKPSPEVIRSVEGAVAWLESARLKGIRLDVQADPKSPSGKNRVVVKNPAAPPLWARFYEIGTNKPLFVDRDGVPKFELADIGYERRNGYAWLGNWPQKLLNEDYPKWKARVGR